MTVNLAAGGGVLGNISVDQVLFAAVIIYFTAAFTLIFLGGLITALLNPTRRTPSGKPETAENAHRITPPPTR